MEKQESFQTNGNETHMVTQDSIEDAKLYSDEEVNQKINEIATKHAKKHATITIEKTYEFNFKAEAVPPKFELSFEYKNKTSYY